MLDPQQAFNWACKTLVAMRACDTSAVKSEHTEGELMMMKVAGTRCTGQPLVELHQEILDEGCKKATIARILHS